MDLEQQSLHVLARESELMLSGIAQAESPEVSLFREIPLSPVLKKPQSVQRRAVRRLSHSSEVPLPCPRAPVATLQIGPRRLPFQGKISLLSRDSCSRLNSSLIPNKRTSSVLIRHLLEEKYKYESAATAIYARKLVRVKKKAENKVHQSRSWKTQYGVPLDCDLRGRLKRSAMSLPTLAAK